MTTLQPSRASAVAHALARPAEDAQTIALRPSSPRSMVGFLAERHEHCRAGSTSGVMPRGKRAFQRNNRVRTIGPIDEPQAASGREEPEGNSIDPIHGIRWKV